MFTFFVNSVRKKIYSNFEVVIKMLLAFLYIIPNNNKNKINGINNDNDNILKIMIIVYLAGHIEIMLIFSNSLVD